MNKTEFSCLKRLFPLLKKRKLLLIGSLSGSLFHVAGQLSIPVLSGYAIDCMIEGAEAFQKTGLLYLLCIALAALCMAAGQRLLQHCNDKLTAGLCRELRDQVAHKLMELPLSYLDSHSTGDVISRMVADIDSLSDGLLMGLSQLFSGVLSILSVLVIMLVLNPPIALAVVVLTPLSIFVARFIARKSHRYFDEQAMIRGHQSGMLHEIIYGQGVIKAYGHGRKSEEDFDICNRQLRDSSMLATFYSSLVNPTTRLVNNLVYAFVVLLGALFAQKGSLSIGQLTVFLSYAGQYAKPFNEISGVVTELQNALSCLKRVLELLDAKERPTEPAAPLDPPVEGRVDIDSLSFRYEESKPLIDGFSLQVQKGQHIAIVGPTGCGKTTLINLLMGFYQPNQGVISVDGAPIEQLGRKNLRKRYGMVLQDTWLSSGSVHENIAYGRPEATREEVVAAAKAAYVHEFIMRLPEGYDTLLQENGSGLSAGEKQLLCIARAMLTLPPMLILDEATSSIDTRTELKIQRAFATLMEGRSSFIVAHRLSTVKEADVILVMKEGHIIEQGSHERLMEKGGFYAELYNSQFAREA